MAVMMLVAAVLAAAFAWRFAASGRQAWLAVLALFFLTAVCAASIDHASALRQSQAAWTNGDNAWKYFEPSLDDWGALAKADLPRCPSPDAIAWSADAVADMLARAADALVRAGVHVERGFPLCSTVATGSAEPGPLTSYRMGVNLATDYRSDLVVFRLPGEPDTHSIVFISSLGTWQRRLVARSLAFFVAEQTLNRIQWWFSGNEGYQAVMSLTWTASISPVLILFVLLARRSVVVERQLRSETPDRAPWWQERYVAWVMPLSEHGEFARAWYRRRVEPAARLVGERMARRKYTWELVRSFPPSLSLWLPEWQPRLFTRLANRR